MFFIPVAKVTQTRFLECQQCKAMYIITDKQYRRIMRSKDSFNEANGVLLALQKKANNDAVKYAERSRKNIGIAVLLSFFFGIFGLQNWYLGHVKRALVANILFMLGCSTILLLYIGIDLGFAYTVIFALCLGSNFYWGIVDAVRIALGFAKDANGKYIMTEKQHRKRLVMK